MDYWKFVYAVGDYTDKVDCCEPLEQADNGTLCGLRDEACDFLGYAYDFEQQDYPGKGGTLDYLPGIIQQLTSIVRRINYILQQRRFGWIDA